MDTMRAGTLRHNPHGIAGWILALALGINGCERDADLGDNGDGDADADADADTDADGDGDADAGPDGGGCVDPPRALRPLSGSIVTSQVPTLEWETPLDGEHTRVEICADRACEQVSQTFEATGGSAFVPEPLAAGVWYWRLGGAPCGPTGPVWQMHVGARSAPADTSWGVVPDFDGDGHADLVVGDPVPGNGTGRVSVFAGGPDGLVDVPSATFDGPDQGSLFGASVAAAGDVDGDGFVDLVVGAPRDELMPGCAEWDPDAPAVCLEYRKGSAFVFFGGEGGLDPARSIELLAPDDQAPFPIETSGFAVSVSGAGDGNGDGYADVAIAAARVGKIYVYDGGSDGPPVAPSRTIETFLSGDGRIGRYPLAFESALDFDGDRKDDLIVGDAVAWEDMWDNAELVRRGENGLDESTRHGFYGGTSTSAFGFAVAAGDVDGDGLSDALVGAPERSSESDTSRLAGAFYLYLGRDPLPNEPEEPGLTPAVSVTGQDRTDERLGRSVSIADVDGDGLGDAIVSAPGRGYDPDQARIAVHLGQAGGVSSTADDELVGSSHFGRLVKALGDVDGDGRADVAVLEDDRVSLYRGDAGGLADAPQTIVVPGSVAIACIVGL